MQIVASTPATVNVRGIREKIVDEKCADCGQRLAVDSYSIRVAWEIPQRQGRPLKFICVDCCLKYDRKSIEFLVDLRQTKGTNKGNQLDENSD